MIYPGKRETTEAYLGTKRVIKMALGDATVWEASSTPSPEYVNFIVGNSRFAVTDDGGSNFKVKAV